MRDLTLENDYVLHHVGDEGATESDIAEALRWAHHLMKKMPSEEIPEISDLFSDDFEDIVSLEQLSYPGHSRGTCLMVSEAIEDYLYSERLSDEINKPFGCITVQGLPTDNQLLNCHYAILVQMTANSVPVIVDFTFSQMNKNAPFPYVNSVQEWQKEMNISLQTLMLR